MKTNFWEKQRLLEYRSRLQRDNRGCPWPASLIAIAKACDGQSDKSERVIAHAKRHYGVSDDDILQLFSHWQERTWATEECHVFIEKKFKKREP